MIAPDASTPAVRFERHPAGPDVIMALPYNYLPAAFPAIAGRATATGCHLFTLAPPGHRRDQADNVVVGVAALRDPEEMARFMRSARTALGTDPRRIFIGPPTGLPQSADLRTLPLRADRKDVPAGIGRVAAIIDGGMAFWDQAFRTNGVSRFHEICFLDLDAGNGANNPARWLDAAAIAEFCTLADTDGSRAVVAKLGEDHPGSFFAGSIANPDQLWHGTAVADLAVGGLKPEVDDVAVYGIELPTSVLWDSDGDNLTAILPLTIEMILAATEHLRDLPLVIVLPFGFVSGPQDGSHPVAAAITGLLGRAGREVRLVVPAGNQLQDQCVAVIDRGTAGAGSSGPPPARSVIWRLPPDDFSVNTADIILDLDPASELSCVLWVTAPGGEPQKIVLPQHGFGLIKTGEQDIGAVIRAADTGTSARIRIVLGETGWESADRLPAPTGDWTISIGGHERAQIFVLRDDRDRETDQARPRRPSMLVDDHYRDFDRSGAHIVDDDGKGRVRRSGTASLLATIPGVFSVGAQERFGAEDARPAWYSGRRTVGESLSAEELVDDGWSLRGVDCAANGTAQRGRISGTSAAAGLAARKLLVPGPATGCGQAKT